VLSVLCVETLLVTEDAESIVSVAASEPTALVAHTRQSW
jgi:hypothetical protein